MSGEKDQARSTTAKGVRECGIRARAYTKRGRNLASEIETVRENASISKLVTRWTSRRPKLAPNLEPLAGTCGRPQCIHEHCMHLRWAAGCKLSWLISPHEHLREMLDAGWYAWAPLRRRQIIGEILRIDTEVDPNELAREEARGRRASAFKRKEKP